MTVTKTEYVAALHLGSKVIFTPVLPHLSITVQLLNQINIKSVSSIQINLEIWGGVEH